MDVEPTDGGLWSNTMTGAPRPAGMPAAPGTIVIRMMRADDLVAIARCVRRCYGASYPLEVVADPVRMGMMLAEGRIDGCVSVTPGGRVVGFLAMLFHGPEARVCETAIAVVEPRLRGRRLFERMKTMAMGEAARRDLLGIHSEAVTIHGASQKGNLAVGARETGVLLGFSPAELVFLGIHDAPKPCRQTTLMYHRRVRREPHRRLYAPPHHAAVITEICANARLDRTVVVPGPVAPETVLGLRTRHSVEEQAAFGHATIRVASYGGDAAAVVGGTLDALCRRGTACIYLDLPLSHPLTATACAGFERLGFIFAGLLVEAADGDLLRLQFLNRVAIDPGDIVTVSPFARRLVDYVLMRHGESARPPPRLWDVPGDAARL